MNLSYSPSTDTYWDTDTNQQVPKDIAEMGTLGAAWEGLQRLGGDIGRNLDDTIIPGDWTDPRTPEENQRWEQVQQANPIGAFIGHSGPQFIPAVRGGMLAQAGLGALQGYVAGDPNQSALERAGWGGVGGFAGDVIGRIAGRVRNAFGRNDELLENPNPMYQQLREEGGKAFPSAQYNNRTLKNIESAYEAGGWTGELFDEIPEYNKALVAKKVASAIGIEDVDDISRLDYQMVKNQRKALGDQFNDLAEEIPAIRLEGDVADAARGLFDKNTKMYLKLKGFEIPKKGDFDVDGPTAALLRSAASKTSSGQKTGSKLLGGEMVERLDDMIYAGAPDDLKPAYARLREQWGVSEAIKSPSQWTTEGKPNYKSLFNSLVRNESKKGYQQGESGSAMRTLQAAGSDELKDLFNMSNTNRAGRGFMDVPNLLQRPMVERYLEEGSGALPGMLGIMKLPADPLYPQIGGQLGRGLLAGD